MRSLEALAVDDAWAGFVVFLLGDPHLLEGGQGSQDGATDPDGVLPFWGSDDLDLDGGWGKSGDFLLHTIGNTYRQKRSVSAQPFEDEECLQ